MRTTVQLTGADKVQGKLNTLRKRVRSKIVRKAVDAGALIVLRSVRSRLKKRTGQAVKALGRKGKTSRFGYYSKVGSRTGFSINYKGRAYDPQKHLHQVEQGTKPHVITSRRGASYRHPGAKPQPSLEPSLTDNIGQIRSTMAQKTWDGIKEAVSQS